MTQQHDAESRSRRITEDSRGATHGMVRRLTERVDELEKRLGALEAEPTEPREPLQHSEW